MGAVPSVTSASLSRSFINHNELVAARRPMNGWKLIRPVESGPPGE